MHVIGWGIRLKCGHARQDLPHRSVHRVALPVRTEAYASSILPDDQALTLECGPLFHLVARTELAVFYGRAGTYTDIVAKDDILQTRTTVSSGSGQTYFSSIVQKSQITQPDSLAPRPITQCRPTIVFFRLDRSPNLLLSSTRLSAI